MRSVFIIVISVVFASMAQIQSIGASGSVDWGKRTVIATGIGAPPPNVPLAAKRPNALRAAWAVAMRNALETVKGVQVTSTTTIENAMVANDVVNTSISGYVKSFEKKGRTKYMSDGSVEVTYEITIDGELANAVLPHEIGNTPSINSMPEVNAPKTVFTGLVVDCRGLSVTPAIAPKILDENGKEIYGSAYVNRKWAVKYGMTGYAKSVEQVKRLKDRIGEKPGIVKALRASGPNKTDVVLAKKDADAIRSAAENLKFLAECRVVLIVD